MGTTRTSRRGPADAQRAVRGHDDHQATSAAGELQRTIGNQALLRRVAASGDDDDAVHRIADHGATGAARPLPFADRIAAAFGRHDIGHVRAHTGARASEAAHALGARAYTRGASVVFGRAPDLRTAAHEAAHVVQQRGGVRLKSALGERGDVHERHADAVADRVVAGRSAEDLLDRYAGGGAAPGAPVVQRWGEPDHYMMGQRAGRKVVAELDRIEQTDKTITYKLGDDERDLSEDRDYEQSDKDPKKVKRVEVDSSEKFFLRGPEGDPMSLGAANRFAGDFTKKAIESDKTHPSVSLDDMPKKIREEYPKDLAEQKRIRSTDGDFMAERFRVRKEYLDTGGFTEYTLMATNANHFFPLSTIEYRRQHAKALQKVWIATRMWERASALTELDPGKAKLAKARANEAFREAVMIEGFAGHFLADCFAAGHLAPHALGRIGDKSPVTAGARVNTWHDLFNALPNGIPTSLGTFHGDYSMDGHDLEYVSSVIANSLLEVTMPWYAGQPFDGNVVTPVPDVAAIRRDPVAGPLWRTMCGDYDAFFRSLQAGTGRRKTKMGLSKYILYVTSADSSVSKDEIMPMIAEHVFGGEVGLGRIDDTKIASDVRGKVHTIVHALAQVLGWRSGYQKATGLGQKYGMRPLKPGFKYNMSLRSHQLAKFSPTTNPRKSLIAELEHWLGVWREANKGVESVQERETMLLDDLTGLLALKEDVKEKTRKSWMAKIKEVLDDFAALDAKYQLQSPLSDPVPHVEQGPDEDRHESSSSGTGIVAKDDLVDIYSGARGPLTRFEWALKAVLADPRPIDDADHRELYELFLEAAKEFESDLQGRYSATLEIEAPDIRIFSAEAVIHGLAHKIPTLRDGGIGLIATRKETYRRDTIAALKLDLAGLFDITPEALMRTTGRSI